MEWMLDELCVLWGLLCHHGDVTQLVDVKGSYW